MNKLAKVYDDLLNDPDGVKKYHDFVLNQKIEGPILELACGTGHLSQALLEDGFQILGLDIDPAMLKASIFKGEMVCRDMRDLKGLKTFQTILCFADSMNFLLEKEDIFQVFAEVKKHLCPQGIFLFDMHHPDILKTYQEPYLEEGVLPSGLAYQWELYSQEDYLIHQFVFFDPDPQIEQVIQRVYPLEMIQEALESLGFEVNMWVDFDQDPTTSGEKIFVKAWVKDGSSKD